jgi:hypothetical protein
MFPQVVFVMQNGEANNRGEFNIYAGKKTLRNLLIKAKAIFRLIARIINKKSSP